MIDIQKVFDALASPIRREILWLIREKELAAGAIATAVGLTPPTVSEHLAVLRGAGLVEVRAAGTYRYHRTRGDVLDGLQAMVRAEGARWTPADDLPERAEAAARTALVVIASTDVPCDRATTFRGFTDAQLYSRWLGVPVTIDADGHFACTMEWGTTVRGRYVELCPPSLIAMSWDFADDAVPVPGGERDAYARFTEAGDGCHVEVHQLVADQHQATFMRNAWAMVLGRLRQGLAAAVSADSPAARRPARPKHRPG